MILRIALNGLERLRTISKKIVQTALSLGRFSSIYTNFYSFLNSPRAV